MKNVVSNPFSNLYTRTTLKDEYSELTRPLFFRYKHIDIKIPQGFKTDFVTVPRFFWWYIYPTGDLQFPAIIHDYLYSNVSSLEYSREKADKMFLLAMKLIGVGWLKRHIAYYSVRLFGQKYYKVD